MTFSHGVDESALRQHYREPHPLVIAKAIDHVDAAVRGFLATSPFVVLATSSDRATDASPRGGPPGFVRVLDDHRIAFGDLAGNNRVDSIGNITRNPAVGLLVIVPGVDETLRISGRATLTTDPAVLEATTIDGRVPKLAIGIDVDACFIHCAKAFRRSGLWSPDTWPAPDDQPSAACAIRDHLDLDVAPELIAADLEAGYTATMWEAGGA